jgi:hypothetical protein
MKKLPIILAVTAMAAIAYLAISSQTHVRAAVAYSAGSVKGSYGFTEQGTYGLNNPLTGLGIVNTDGNGGLWGSETFQTVGTATQTLQFQGTYMVNSDGTGSLMFTYTNPATDPNSGNVIGPTQATYNFVVVNNQLQLQAIRSDNNIMVGATFTRQ